MTPGLEGLAARPQLILCSLRPAPSSRKHHHACMCLKCHFAQVVCVSSVMVTGGRDDDARSRPLACQPATRGEGDASSSGVAGRVPMTDTSAEVEVVAKNGRRVKLNGPIEVTWSHGEPYPHPHGAGFMCFYYFKKVRGGGVTRLKEHLAGATGNVAKCPNVPAYIKDLMSSEVVKGKVRRKRSNDIRLFVEKEVMAANIGHGRPRNALDEATQVETAMRESLRGSNSALENGSSSPFGRLSGSGAASCSGNRQTRIDRFYQSPQSASNAPFDIDLARCRAQAQPRVDVMLMGGAKEKIGKAWAKFFHANDIPGRKADCPYFRSALKLSQQLGEGVQIPTGREIDSPLLDMNFQDAEVHMRQFKEDWHEYGVTIMCDSWTGPTLMSIINFMVYCNGRMFFLKSVNATRLIQNADYIHLMEVIKVRLQYLVNGNLMIAAAALNLKALYTHKLARRTTYRHAVTLAFRKLASSSSKASAAIDQYTIFSKQGGLFGGEEARRSALSGKMSPGDGDAGGSCGNTSGVGQPSRGEESNGGQAGARDVQPAPLRPRSKRLKKVSVKGLYGK